MSNNLELIWMKILVAIKEQSQDFKVLLAEEVSRLIWLQLSFVGVSQVLQIDIIQKNDMVVFNPFNKLFDAESLYCEKPSVQVGQSVIEDDEFMGFLGGLEWRDESNDTLDEVLEVFLNLKFVESVFILEGNLQHGGAEVPTES